MVRTDIVYLKNFLTNPPGNGVTEVYMDDLKVPLYTPISGSGGCDCEDIIKSIDVLDYYTTKEPTTVTIGGSPSGSTYVNKKVIELLDEILHPYVEPSITSFTTPRNTFEIGTESPNPLVLSWNTSTQSNIKSIFITYDGTKISDDTLSKSGSNVSFNVAPIKLNNQGAKKVLLTIISTRDRTYTKEITLTWNNIIYYGTSVEDTISTGVVNTLSYISANSVGRTYKFPAGGYKYLLIPNTWNDITSMIDTKTQFQFNMNKVGTISITKNGVVQNYKVYRSGEFLGGEFSISVK